MPASTLVADSLSKDVLKQLMKTTRPFYHKSLELVLACRRIPQPASDNTTQIKEWNKLLNEVETTLAWGIKKKLSDKDLDVANNSFKDQYERVNAYINKYHLPKAEKLEWEGVSKKDRMAEGWIKKVKADVQTKVEGLKSIPTLKLGITLWPEIPRIWGTKGWSYESYTLDFHIETTATLDILLHRLLESKSLLKSDHWKSISLKHNPQFYRKFPDNVAHFGRQHPSSSETLHIPAVGVRSKVTKFQTLHVIVDRESESRQISLRNQSKVVALPDQCGNGWPLDGDEMSIAVKLKGFAPAIVVWNTKNPFGGHLSHPSAITLIDDSVDSGSSLSPEELDLEFESVKTDSAADVSDAHSQATFPDQTGEGASRFYPPPWGNPSDATLAPSVVMPTPRLAETERNPGSSRHHDTYRSSPGVNHIAPWLATEHNSQVQMPVPTIHGKTPLGRIATSPQSLQGSPFRSANIPANPALGPTFVPVDTSSRSPANPPTQVPAIRAQEIPGEGPRLDPILPKAPSEIRVDEIPTPTPPLRVGQPVNPISRRKPAINVNPSLPVPSSPASFTSYFSPGSPSMRMVESESSPATPSGRLGGWFKKKLQNFVGAPSR